MNRSTIKFFNPTTIHGPYGKNPKFHGGLPGLAFGSEFVRPLIGLNLLGAITVLYLPDTPPKGAMDVTEIFYDSAAKIDAAWKFLGWGLQANVDTAVRLKAELEQLRSSAIELSNDSGAWVVLTNRRLGSTELAAGEFPGHTQLPWIPSVLYRTRLRENPVVQCSTAKLPLVRRGEVVVATLKNGREVPVSGARLPADGEWVYGSLGWSRHQPSLF